jgi:hypothetical protein
MRRQYSAIMLGHVTPVNERPTHPTGQCWLTARWSTRSLMLCDLIMTRSISWMYMLLSISSRPRFSGTVGSSRPTSDHGISGPPSGGLYMVRWPAPQQERSRIVLGSWECSPSSPQPTSNPRNVISPAGILNDNITAETVFEFLGRGSMLCRRRQPNRSPNAVTPLLGPTSVGSVGVGIPNYVTPSDLDSGRQRFGVQDPEEASIHSCAPALPRSCRSPWEAPERREAANCS